MSLPFAEPARPAADADALLHGLADDATAFDASAAACLRAVARGEPVTTFDALDHVELAMLARLLAAAWPMLRSDPDDIAREAAARLAPLIVAAWDEIEARGGRLAQLPDADADALLREQANAHRARREAHGPSTLN